MTNDSMDDIEHPELRARLKQATAGDRPSSALLARVEVLAREMEAVRTEPARYRAATGELSLELFPRLVSFLGIMSLMIGTLIHFPVAEGLGRLFQHSGVTGGSHGFTSGFLSSATVFLLFPIVVLLFADVVTGGRFLKRWFG